MLKVLISAYACSPEWGSEVGMGWNWVCQLARHCELHVITESGFRAAIEAAGTAPFESGSQPVFHYLDIGESGRKKFWEQGNWGFYLHYRRWQRQAAQLAETLLHDEHFDIVHQLNMVGFREPGYLWRLRGTFRYVWGPICGMGQVPAPFIRTLEFGSRWKYYIKNWINFLQQYGLWRVHRALHRADAVLVVTGEEQRVLRNFYHRESMLVSEVGTSSLPEVLPKTAHQGPLELVWCGVMVGCKALNLALSAMARIREQGVDCRLHIIGDGPCRPDWQRQSQELQLGDRCIWYGRLSHDEALAVMQRCDLCWHSSWKEATSTVIVEALSLGLGVICHDACGMGVAVTPDCGIKVPLISPEVSVEGFARAICRIDRDRDLIARFSRGALDRGREFSWSQQVQRVIACYEQLMRENPAKK